MKKVFADTGYWIALLNPSDELHQKARIITAFLMPSLEIITSEMI
jgi:predicted nucleic acid-binding protein